MTKARQLSFEGWPAPEPREHFNLDEMMQKSVELYGTPSAIFETILVDIPDNQLLAFMELMERIHVITTEKHADSYGVDWFSPLQPDLMRAEIMPDSLHKVPVADRSTFQEFLQQEEVAQAIRAGYQQHTEQDTTQPFEETFGDQDTPLIQSDIESLPVTVQPLDANTLFNIVSAHYRSEEGKKKYVSPADTLRDITKNASPEMVIPLILLIGDRFPFTIDDGRYPSIVWPHLANEQVVENGIIWGVYTPTALRGQLEDACEPYVPELDLFKGFNGEWFNEWYSNVFAEKSRTTTDQSEEAAMLDFLDEQNRRHKETYGW